MVAEPVDGQQIILCINNTDTGELQAKENTDDKLVMPKCDVVIGERTVTVLADSGSPFTLIGDKNWARIFGDDNINLFPPDISPVGYGGQKIDLFGYSLMSIKFKGRETLGKVYVAKRGNNLLGFPFLTGEDVLLGLPDVLEIRGTEIWGVLAVPVSPEVFRFFIPFLFLSVSVSSLFCAPRAKSVFFFYLFGNSDIRVPWEVSGVPVVMVSGCGIVYIAESGHRSRFCEAGSRNIR
ncbi:hypothetical protein NDU88_006173 [Pleurodeles waltl]|uniref:Peptidase A2 domain-containing protein n=1 Tax=Pleurodeles waltl TaxID=8319 RepID=A0AAV7X2X3_PLEWA|nr:hypothetical protein NDU88_006173 [Pleurodeles waltl]